MLAQEVLTALLMLPVASLGAANENTLNNCDITVADILGPKVPTPAGVRSDVTDRDANFSLLSYSFSLVHPSNLEPSNTEGAARFTGLVALQGRGENVQCVEGGCGVARVWARWKYRRRSLRYLHLSQRDFARRTRHCATKLASKWV